MDPWEIHLRDQTGKAVQQIAVVAKVVVEGFEDAGFDRSEANWWAQMIVHPMIHDMLGTGK